MSAEPTLEPPGPGQWYYTAEHLPGAVSTLFAEVFPPVARGWGIGADRYGLPPHPAEFGPVGRYLYYSPGDPTAATIDPDELGQRAEEALATQRWREDLRTWAEETRPTVMTASRALVRVDLEALDDDALADHLDETVAHFQRWGPEHFALMPVQGTAGGTLVEAARGWGIDPAELAPALAGAAGATSSGDGLLERIAAGVRAAGLERVDDLDRLRTLDGDAVAAFEELLTDYAWRSLGTDVTPTLAEQPEAMVALVNGAVARTGPRARPDPERLDALRDQVPDDERARFDDLVAVGRVAYGFNDDNTVILFAMPIGLIRRAVLEVGRRLAERGQLLDADDAFEATTGELHALFRGDGPTADVLAARRTEREAAARVTPPFAVGEPLPSDATVVELHPATRRLGALYEAWWSAAGRPGGEGRAAATVGTEAVRGRALVTIEPVDALVRLEPGDVLVTDTTHAAWNVVFPLLAAVAVEHGGAMGHAAILARELGLTAVIGVPGLLDRVQDGDQVEVDPGAGTITVVEE